MCSTLTINLPQAAMRINTKESDLFIEENASDTKTTQDEDKLMEGGRHFEYQD